MEKKLGDYIENFWISRDGEVSLLETPFLYDFENLGFSAPKVVKVSIGAMEGAADNHTRHLSLYGELSQA